MVATFQEDKVTSSVASSPLQVFSTMSLTRPPTLLLSSPSSPFQDLKPEERGLFLIHLLLTCANHVASGSLQNANAALDQLSHLVSPGGDTMQRVAAYFTEALANRILKSWPGLYKALNATQTRTNNVSEEVHVRRLFFDMFPILKVSYLLTNRAILEAMEGEKMVHVIDLHASEPAQWLALIQAFNSRPEGPPHLRITGVHRHKEVLDQMAHRLIEEAEKLDIPFQFNPVVSSLDCLDVEQLPVKTGEALAVSSVLQLHNFLASDVNNNNNGHSLSGDSASSLPLFNSGKIDSFLNAIWGLSPKVMVVTEQDSDHNGSTLMERLLESLYTYAALFDCLETKVPRTSQDRIKVEKMVFGEEIKDIIACEGSERRERHEKLEKWSQRFDFDGFGNVPLSYFAMLQARRLLQGYGFDGYRIKEESGCAVICWQDRPLYSVSAWRCRK
ncbi:Scarecrow-like protein 3 [Raphanus sativus]|uniref:Scarecrow-like protein 3 n=1 Tax=Raphanus sativus TaxID=3726 RepID=A0A6J0NPM7_RAPSA|nr:scarecrow-like protein 3 [Raphanus sativus]XP_018486645.1 scarecrow-like protein 3 [Raphanus sativus]KAJ4896604.1 Scarecrow-like protein 3 [Raphanus sativus]